MIGSLTTFARLVRDARGWSPSHARVLVGDVLARERNAAAGYTDEDHLLAAAGWLARAQDATRDGGVAGRFRLGGGWTSSYPETTGYLVPTFLDLAKEPALTSFEERAARAVDFLLRHQLPDGAFPGGEVAENTTRPSVFNTAQIVCGLVAWHRHTGDQRTIDAAVRAGDWLVAQQGDDGAWSKHVYLDLPAAYAAHASCWLAELGQHVGSAEYRESARRHLRWVLALVDPETGWFDRAGFSAQQHADRVAFTHTIAYTLWGVQMSSELLADPEGIAAATKAAWAIARRLELERSLGGILDHRWRRRADFSCVTGAAQMALVWMRQFERDGDIRLVNAALLAIDTVKRAQLMRTANHGLHGGIPGSDPVWGEYIGLAYPNWAAKFFIDALLSKRRTLELMPQNRHAEGSAPDVINRFFPPMVTMRAAVEHGAQEGRDETSRQQYRIVLYTAPLSTKVAQMLAAWSSWGFRPAAVVIESPPFPSAVNRVKSLLRERGLAGVWNSVGARARKHGAGAGTPIAGASAETGAQLLPREACRRAGIPIVEVTSLASPAGVAAVAALQPDLAVHAGAGILRDEILRVPRLGTLNAHMGVLPRYRGMNVAEWAALEGGPVGCSVHFVAQGIDTGPVLAVRVVHTTQVRSIEELRAVVDEQQISLLGDVLRAVWERGAEMPQPLEQPPTGGLQFFRMHPELRELLAEALRAG